MNGSGLPVTGKTPVTAAMFSTAWNASMPVSAPATSRPKGSRAPIAMRMPAYEQDGEGQHDRERADQPGLLADDREDEVGVGLGQVEELLPRESQAHALDAAGAKGEQRLDRLVAAPLGVAPRIQRGDDALDAVRRDGDHEDAEGRRPARQPSRPTAARSRPGTARCRRRPPSGSWCPDRAERR